MELTAEEIRVLGCLVEKAATTPDNYPLSTNALTSACNQKSSRDPVVGYNERQVTETMLLLRAASLARTVTGGGRVEKHRHTLDEAWGLTEPQLAVLAIMMLRGPQSPGELKTRTERYVAFADLADIETVLISLRDRGEPLVVNVGRAPGQSQDRWMHLLADGDPVVGGDADVASPRAAQAMPSTAAPLPSQAPQIQPSQATAPTTTGPDLEARVAALEARMAQLEAELGIDTND